MMSDNGLLAVYKEAKLFVHIRIELFLLLFLYLCVTCFISFGYKLSHLFFL